MSRTIFRSRTLADKIWVFQNQDAAGVDAVGVAVRVIVDRFRVTKESNDKINIINIEIHQGSAAVGGVKHRRSLPIHKGIIPAGILAEGARYRLDVTNLLCKQLCHTIVRMVDGRNSLQQVQMALFRKAEQFIQLRHGGNDGLLAENVLSGK